MSSKPHISIGMPLFNAEDFVAEAIDSVLAQTYADFELIISDNASTDKTEEICRAYAAKDGRIRYYRNHENLGASQNYNRTFELARGDYFRWLAGDDLLAPTLLEKSAAILEARPEVVLCFTKVIDIDEVGNEISHKESTAKSNLARPHERFRGLSELRGSHNCEEVFGMVRSEVLVQTKLIANYSDSDRTLLAELGLYGPFYEIPEYLFLHRLHKKGSVAVNPGRQERMAWFDPKNADRITLPTWRQFWELLGAIWRGPISWKERLYCYGHMLHWLKRGRRRMRRDVVWAMKQLV